MAGWMSSIPRLGVYRYQDCAPFVFYLVLQVWPSSEDQTLALTPERLTVWREIQATEETCDVIFFIQLINRSPCSWALLL